MILLFWLGVWQITAVCVDNFLLVVTPLQALRALTVLAGQVEFWRSALGSLWRRKSCARSWYFARQCRLQYLRCFY